jgi:K+-transporting ATPase c subunit
LRRSDLIAFVHKSAGKALDFSMTGSRFPMEMELVYSSDSEVDSELPDEIAIEAQATIKSADAIEKKVYKKVLTRQQTPAENEL